MRSSFVALALCAASAFALPQEQIAGQFQVLTKKDSLCPDNPAGTVFNNNDGKQYQIYCSNLLTGTVVQSSNEPNFGACIDKCDTFNKNNPNKKESNMCHAITYNRFNSPSCQLLGGDFGGFFFADKVNSAVFLKKNNGGNPDRTFNKLDLPPPHNFVAGFNLYPFNLLLQLTGRIEDYNHANWSSFVLDHCKRFKGCTSEITFAASSNGPGQGRHWFGFLYSGGHTTKQNYTRADGFYSVRHSTAFTIPKK